jgi:hypothetical protein
MAFLLLREVIAGADRIENGTNHTENTVSNDSSIVACISVVAGTCLPSRYLATAVFLGLNFWLSS